MSSKQLEKVIVERGKEFFAAIGDEAPSLFKKNWWTGKVMDWCMKNDQFKVQLFRFIDVLPYLTTEDSLGRHIQEYFARDENVPGVLRAGTKLTGLGGRMAMKVLGKTIRKNLEMMARDFIVGADVKETVKKLGKLRKQGFACTLDLLGEATISEKEADDYVAGYLELLDGLAEAQKDWQPLGDGEGDLDWGDSPKLNVSIKPSALYSQAKPVDFEGTVEGILPRLKTVYRRVLEAGGFMCIDTEKRELKNVTFELYRRLRSDPEFRSYPNVGMAVQVYLPETDRDIDGLIDWAKTNRLPVSVRIVKGAYWDYETVMARQHGWPSPVYTIKEHSDAAFERNAEKILRNHEYCHLACASHNVRSVSAVMEMARAFDVPEDRYEFQALYGMAEPFRKALLRMSPRLRLYCPHGEMLPGMAYLIRRLLENTSNESFLKLTFADHVEMERLLVAPRYDPDKEPKPEPAGDDELKPFDNEPVPDWALLTARKAYRDALDDVKKRLGKTYPLTIGGEDVSTDEVIDSVNPAEPSKVVGRACQAGEKEVTDAIAAAEKAFPDWRDTAPRERAGYLIKAAAVGRRRLFELAAWQTLEAGKQWTQAYLDVTEAIDFMEYYAREMIRLAEPRYMGDKPGESNRYFYQPKGIAAVISPWNFPLAIGCGMAAAAIVTGNCVVFKPSNLTPVVGNTLNEIFREAGLPDGVFNFTPGKGSVMGSFLVKHPGISVIAFTGSMDVGLDIIKKAGETQEGQANVKKVISEMGGKNAIIVDDDADLDAAVPQVVYSAFGYQGQKCSACSRVIVLDAAYDRFIERLLEATRSLKIGPAEDPSNYMGPVIDGDARENIREYIDLAGKEGDVVYSSETPDGGHYVPITIVEGITPEHRLAQEEIFGPVLSVMRAKDFDQAIEWANSTRFALTGALFSRSPEHIERVRKEFRVGNLYINKGSTGAIVGRQAFGGFKMSGVGTKAGGPDYLLHFMDPRSVTENTMRRGFVPTEEIEADEE